MPILLVNEYTKARERNLFTLWLVVCLSIFITDMLDDYDDDTLCEMS